MRRRLFDPILEGNARIRDGVIRVFSEMYHDQARVFPSGVGEAEYRRRMELSYPIHPELLRLSRVLLKWGGDPSLGRAGLAWFGGPPKTPD